jgi:hypothetical protein
MRLIRRISREGPVFSFLGYLPGEYPVSSQSTDFPNSRLPANQFTELDLTCQKGSTPS